MTSGLFRNPYIMNKPVQRVPVALNFLVHLSIIPRFQRVDQQAFSFWPLARSCLCQESWEGAKDPKHGETSERCVLWNSEPKKGYSMHADSIRETEIYFLFLLVLILWRTLKDHLFINLWHFVLLHLIKPKRFEYVLPCSLDSF